VVGVKFTASEWVGGSHTMEFYAAGTAVRRIGERNLLTPSPVLPM
jgi:hypothetical protein